MTDVALNNTADAVALLSEEITSAHRSGVSFKRMHERTGLAVSTISKLYYRQTRFPRWATITALLVFFNYQLFARRGSNVVGMRRSA